MDEIATGLGWNNVRARALTMKTALKSGRWSDCLVTGVGFLIAQGGGRWRMRAISVTEVTYCRWRNGYGGVRSLRRQAPAAFDEDLRAGAGR